MSRKLITEIIAALLILLWVYAATSKLLDYETFKIQLGKSPLITSFAGFAAIAVPLSELIISMALLIRKYRLIVFYASLFMLVMFTAYLIAILNFSYYVPCSCGGILQGLSWNTHIFFNIGYAILATVGIVLRPKPEPPEHYKYDQLTVSNMILSADNQE